MKSTAEKIAIMQAFEDGKTIENRYRGGASPTSFTLVNNPVWDWHTFDYRVADTKPSINWDHVSEEYNWLARDRGGRAILFRNKPYIYSSLWLSKTSYSHIGASVFSSYDPGDCAWVDSLVKRPGHSED